MPLNTLWRNVPLPSIKPRLLQLHSHAVQVKFTEHDPEDIRVDAPTVGLERPSLPKVARASGGHGPRPHNQAQPANPPSYAPVGDDMDNDLEREQKAKLGKGSASHSRGLNRGSVTRSRDLNRDSLGMYRLP